MEVNNIQNIHADAVKEEEKSLDNMVWSHPVELDDLNSLHADAVMDARNKNKRRRRGKNNFSEDEENILSSPVELDDLNDLHSDAVMEAKRTQSLGKLWFEAIDAKTLDKVITEMNEMNRWFAKVSCIAPLFDTYLARFSGREILG